MDKNILSKCAVGSQKFKESGSPPEDLKVNSQLKGRKVWRGTVEARDLRGSRRGVLGSSEPFGPSLWLHPDSNPVQCISST